MWCLIWCFSFCLTSKGSILQYFFDGKGRYAKNMHFEKYRQKLCKKYALLHMHFWWLPILSKNQKNLEKSAYFLHIFCIFHEKIKENCPTLAICKKYAENMRKICTFPKIFGKGQNSQKLQKTSRKVHIFCIFSAYFLHISLKIKENCQKLAICKKYAENMRKICTFPKIFGKGQNSQKLQKTSRKVHIFCIFFAYFLHISLKIKENCQKLAICKKYAENMRKICTFPKIFRKVKIIKNCKKPREKCIFSAYFLRIFCIFPIFGNFL